MRADTITAIKKALEKVYVGGWYISGVKTNGLSVVHSASDSSMFGITAETFEAEYVVAANPFAVSELLSTLESLQRENEELKIDASNHAADAETVRRYRDIERRRADAAEAEVKRLRNKVAARALTDKQLADEIEAIDEACKGGFGEGGGSPGEWWYERADELEHERKRRELESQLQQHNSRIALFSTGDTHGN